MTNFRNADDVINFAITREEEAARFYEEQAEKMNRPEMRQVFLDFAKEEKIHKQKLLAIKEGKLTMPSSQKVQDLKIADYQSATPQVGPYMTYADMLLVAMQKEKEAFKLYMDLVSSVDNDELRAAFQSLASEEARHKLRFELEYDKEVYSEN